MAMQMALSNNLCVPIRPSGGEVADWIPRLRMSTSAWSGGDRLAKPGTGGGIGVTLPIYKS